MLLLAQITDLHIDNANPELTEINSRAKALATLEAIYQEKIDRLIITGDLAETEAGMDWFLEQVKQRGLAWEFIPGNHDARPSLTRVTGPGQTPSYFARQFEGFQVLFLDSKNYLVEREQLTWLEQQLSANPEEILIFIHHPVLDCGKSLMDQKYRLKNREDVLKILVEANRQIALFCGHYHIEEIVKHGKIVQYVTPSTFYQIKKYSAGIEIESLRSGYRLLSLATGSYTTQVKYTAL